MSKGYWIARVNINDTNAFKEYASRAKLAIEKYGGKYITRGGNFSILEGEHNFERNVVVEFDSVAKAQECFNSNEYQEAHDILKGHAERHHQTIEGT